MTCRYRQGAVLCSVMEHPTAAQLRTAAARAARRTAANEKKAIALRDEDWICIPPWHAGAFELMVHEFARYSGISKHDVLAALGMDRWAVD